MIEIRQLSHDFDGRPVLCEISLTLTEQRIGIIGSSGSGKSTFARTLNALMQPKHGEILIGGVSARQDAARRAAWVGRASAPLKTRWSCALWRGTGRSYYGTRALKTIGSMRGG